MKELADDNFKFDENGRKFSKRVENIVGKGEIAHYEQFLLFSQCFQKTYTADMLQAISPFPTMFSKDLHCRHIKKKSGAFGKGLRVSAADNLNVA